MPDNIDTMAYAHEVPWHGLGENVDPTASVDTWLKASKINWPVELINVEWEWNGKRHMTDKIKLMLRGDTGDILDKVGPNYVPTQNNEVLEFFREYVDTGDMQIETVGSLLGGKYIWALAKMHRDFKLPGNDQVLGYVLLANPHQYGKAMIAKFTQVRVVCWNTYTAALAAGGEGIRIWHNRAFDDDARREAKRRLGIARDRMDAMEEAAARLVMLELTREEATGITAKVLKADPEQPLEKQTRTVKRVIELWEGAGLGATLKSAAGTGWGLLNATTQYIDHEYGRTNDRRLAHSWLGGGEVTKRRAMEELIAVAPKLR